MNNSQNIKKKKKEERMLKFHDLQEKIFKSNKDVRKRKQKIINNITKKCNKIFEIEKNRNMENDNKTDKLMENENETDKLRKEKYFLSNYNLNDNNKTDEQIEIEKKIAKLVKNGKFDEAELLNKQLSTLIMKENVKKALECSEYMEKRRELYLKRKKSPKLYWRFSAKERWEQKGNS